MDLPILPTISTLFIVLSAITVAIGWYLIKQGKQKEHMYTMITAGVFALTFFIIYASRTIFIGNTSFGGPDNIKIFYTIFLIFHITFATIGGVLGIIMLISGFKRNFTFHRKFGPTTSIIWFLTGVTGPIVYILLYVSYPGGDTTSVIKAILGG